MDSLVLQEGPFYFLPMPDSTRLVRCVKNLGYPFSLRVGQTYQWLPDPQAEATGMLRVVDETDGDYLFPISFFEPVEGTWKLSVDET
jgi:hypothetical protein